MPVRRYHERCISSGQMDCHQKARGCSKATGGDDSVSKRNKFAPWCLSSVFTITSYDLWILFLIDLTIRRKVALTERKVRQRLESLNTTLQSMPLQNGRVIGDVAVVKRQVEEGTRVI
jgi:hypothetical protein